MIISASYKTDIPAFYGSWFRARRATGHCEVQNPWNRKNFTVSLRDADCSGFVFWTRNARPFGPELARTARTHPFLVQYTLTGLPRWLERSVISVEDAISDISRISTQYGRDSVVWRYDPIVNSNTTPPDWHLTNFRQIADDLSGTVDEVVVSFAQIYRKTRRNLEQAAHKHEAEWRDPDRNEKGDLLAQLHTIAADRGLTLTTCTQPELAGGPAEPARCIDADRLNRVATHLGHAAITARSKGQRPGCLCAEARDIGAYNSCAHGCVYCYAVEDAAAARHAHRGHDAAAPNLTPVTMGHAPKKALNS